MRTLPPRATFAPFLLDYDDCVRLWPLVLIRTPPGVDLDLAYRIEGLIHRPEWAPGHITLAAMQRLAFAATQEGAE